MTTPPPPPPGNYPPPPPPPGGGFPPPPPPQGGFGPPTGGGPPGGGLPTDAYTPWLTRVLAWIIDYIPVFILSGIGYGIEAATQETVCISDTSGYDLGDFCATGNSTIGVISLVAFSLLGLAFAIWNLGYKQGTTGSSIGKGIMKFKIVGETTGQPVGFGMSFVREVLYYIAEVLCFVPWLVAVLFPLWDVKRQTLVDKILKHVALPLS